MILSVFGFFGVFAFGALWAYFAQFRVCFARFGCVLRNLWCVLRVLDVFCAILGVFCAFWPYFAQFWVVLRVCGASVSFFERFFHCVYKKTEYFSAKKMTRAKKYVIMILWCG